MSKSEPFFSAFREERQRRHAWALPAALAGLLLLVLVAAFFFLARPGDDQWQVATVAGLRSVQAGMSEPEVRKELGPPIGVETRAGLRCIRYGMPTLQAPSFLVQEACFDGEGRLVEVRELRFRADRLEEPSEVGAP